MYIDTPPSYLPNDEENHCCGDTPLGRDIIGTPGDPARRDARDVHETPRALVRAVAHGDRPRRRDH